MRRLHRARERALAGLPCEPFGQDVKILADGRRRYRDAVVSCTMQSDSAQEVANPVVVFEMLSESTAHIGRYVILDRIGLPPRF